MREKKLIQLYLTNRCNSKCKTCPIWKCKEKEDLPLDKVKEFILAYKDADFVYGGGEFFLYPDYEKLLRWSEWYDINYTILTNGLLPQKVQQVVSEYKCNITISWDGILHDYIRGIDGNAHKIKKLVEYIRKCGSNVKLSYTFSKYNYETIDEDMKVAKEIFGMNKIYLALGRDSDTFSGKEELVAPKDFHPLIEHLDMFNERDIRFLTDWEANKLPQCSSINDVITVYSNGDIPLCQGIECTKKWGNILKDDIKDIKSDMDSLLGCGTYCKYSDRCYSLCQRRYDYEV